MRVGQRAQASQADGATPEERKDGLVCIMADFHAQLEIIFLAWKLLYDTSSSGDLGSLYSFRNILNARNVTGDATKTYYANDELMRTTTNAYLLLGMCYMVYLLGPNRVKIQGLLLL